MVEVPVLTTHEICPVTAIQHAAVPKSGTVALTGFSRSLPVRLYDEAVALRGRRFCASETTTVPNGPKAKPKGVFPRDSCATGPVVRPWGWTWKISINFVPFSVT